MTALLRQPNFRLLWTGETVSNAGSAMATIGLPLLAATELHAGTFAVALLTAAAYLPWLVLGLPAGAWVDRLPARPLMIACDLLSALLYLSLPVAAWLGLLRTWQLVVVALLAGGVNVFFATAYQVYLPSLVTTAELTEGNAKMQGSAQAAAIAGRGTAGLAAEAIGAATALMINAASFLVSAACLARIRTAPGPARRPGSVRAETWCGLVFVARDPYLRPITVYAAIANLAYSGSMALSVVFLVRVVGLRPAAVGLLAAAGGLGGVAGSLAARRLAGALGSARTLLVATACSGLAGLLIPVTSQGPRLACYAAGAASVSAGIAVGNVVSVTFRQQYCPPAMLGRVTASGRFFGYGTIPLGALLAGELGTVLGVRAAMWVLLALFAASASILLTSDIRSGRDLPAEFGEQRELEVAGPVQPGIK
jgi:predicted MFS family arabinose efflux permease